jgi:hypothetical protein
MPVMLGMELRRFRRVMRCVRMVSMSSMRVVRRCLVVTRLVLPRGFPVVPRGMLMVLCCFVVMMRCFVGHVSSYRSGLPEELHYPGGMVGGDC